MDSSGPRSVCESCGQAYVPQRRKGLAADRFCSHRCQRAARGDVPRWKPKAAGQPRPVLSRVPGLPFQPDLSRGRCATALPEMRDWWTSRSPAEQRAAKTICLACPVLEACREYALALPPGPGCYIDRSVYGGMTWHERKTARKALASAS